MEAERLNGARSRKALSWCLALVMCVQMLGVNATQAFANEVSDVASVASESLGKNLVYDDVYGVKRGALALMINRDLVSDRPGNEREATTQVDLVNSAGDKLASFGMGDMSSSSASDNDKAQRVSAVKGRMERLMAEEFSFYCVPKSVNDEVKYGFTLDNGTEIVSWRYEDFTTTLSDKPALAALDRDGAVVDVYEASGDKAATIPFPTGWDEGWTGEPNVSIGFANNEVSSLRLAIGGSSGAGPDTRKSYVWDVANNSFVLDESESGSLTERVWDLPDGSKVTIAKVEGKDAFKCTTPKGSFNVENTGAIWDFNVFAEGGFIQYRTYPNAQIWDFSGTQVTSFEGAEIKDYMGDDRYLCCQSSTLPPSSQLGSQPSLQYTIRQANGATLKSLPGREYSFTAPFICGTDSDGSCVILDSSGNEEKKLTASSMQSSFSSETSAVEDVLVVKESAYVDGRYVTKAIAAYDTTSKKWLSAEVATKYARVSLTTLLQDESIAYLLPVYEKDDGSVWSQTAPAYYQYVDRNMNVLWPDNGYNAQTAYNQWVFWQQAQRTLPDGTIMGYSADKSGKYGAVDGKGTILIPFEYDAYYDCGDDDSLILLKKGDAWEFFDTKTINTGNDPVPATSVTISGAPNQLPVGATAQLTASIEPADSTDKVKWKSSDESVLKVDTTGLVTAVSNGKASITATAGEFTNSVAIDVVTPATLVTISGEPTDPLNVGSTVQLSAKVEPENSTQTVAWASSDDKVLVVDADGLVTALGNGEATITATAGKQTSSVTIEVTTRVSGIKLDTENLTLYVGDDSSKLEATVLPATASNKAVTWVSSNAAAATVDDSGAVTPVGLGSSTVTATTLDGKFSATCAVTVGEHVSGVKLDRNDASIIGVGTTQLKATVSPDGALDKSVVWSTSDVTVATVSESGLVTAAGKGTATIKATSLDGNLSASCTVKVSNPATGFDFSATNVALTKGNTQAVHAAVRGALPGAVDEGKVVLSVEGEGSFANGVWSDSSGKSVFSIADSVSADGVSRDCTIAALGSGKGTLVFKMQQGTSMVQGVVAVAVTNPAQAVALDLASKQIAVGDESFTLTAAVDPIDADEVGAIAWSTSDAAVALVEKGVVTPVSAGSAVITAQAGSVSGTCVVRVTAKQVAVTEDSSAYQASLEATDSAVAKRLEKIAQDNGGSLSLAMRVAENLTKAAQEAIAALPGAQGKVAEILDVALRNSKGDEVSVDLADDGLMTVRVQMTETMRELDPTTLKVSYVADDGAIEAKRTWVEGEDLCFATEHFSTYVVTGSVPQTPGDVPGTNIPGGGNGGVSNPGDTVNSLLAPTGDTLMLPLALAGCAVVVALICLVSVRGGRRMK